MKFFYHSCASSYHRGFTSSRSFALSHSYSDPAAAGGNNANLDIPTPRQTEKTRNFVHLLLYGGAF